MMYGLSHFSLDTILQRPYYGAIPIARYGQSRTIVDDLPIPFPFAI
jgi:hypothetical protein